MRDAATSDVTDDAEGILAAWRVSRGDAHPELELARLVSVERAEQVVDHPLVSFDAKQLHGPTEQ